MTIYRNKLGCLATHIASCDCQDTEPQERSTRQGQSEGTKPYHQWPPIPRAAGKGAVARNQPQRVCGSWLDNHFQIT